MKRIKRERENWKKEEKKETGCVPPNSAIRFSRLLRPSWIIRWPYSETSHAHRVKFYIYIWGGESLGSIVGGSRLFGVILVLCECIWNAPTVSLFLLAFDDTGSLSSPHQVVYPPV